MMVLRTEATVREDGSLMINNVPFHAGETVEVIILPQHTNQASQDAYPLRGTKVEYIDPFKPVAESDWDACQ